MLRGVLLIALAATAWGTTGSVTAVLVAEAGAHPLLIGAVRMVVAAALLATGARAAAGTLRLAPRDRAWSVVAGTCMAAFQAAYFTAVTLAGIAVTALVAICSAPLLIALLAAWFLGERLTPRILLALAVGVAGTALLVAGPAGSAAGPGTVAGTLLALGAGLAYAVYVIVTKAVLARSPALPLVAANFVVAAAVMAPAFVLADAALDQIARGWPLMLYLGAVATAGAYTLYTAGLGRVPASVAAVVSLLEPLTATLLGVLLFGERLGLLGATGAALLGASLVLVIAARTPRGPSISEGRRSAG